MIAQPSDASLLFAVGVLQIRFKGDVRAEGLRADSLQRREFEIWRDGEGHACFA